MSELTRFYTGRSGERPLGDRFPALRLFNKSSRERLLDIGCHNGALTARVRDYLGATDAWGVDIDSTIMEEARDKGIKATFANLDEAPLPFGDSAFDCVHAGDVLEHVFSPDNILRECHRVLRPGGYVVLTTPNLASWRNRLGLLFGWQPLGSEVSTVIHLGNPFSPVGQPAGHLRVFTPRALVELAQLHGFRLSALHGYAIGGGARAGIAGRSFELIDHAVARFAPRLCDEILARFDKPRT